MKENINLNLLKYFYEVVNTKNITKASKNLFVSQPAITSAIKELEEEFKVKLLNRSKKGVTPTLEGEILYNNIKEIFKNLNTTINTIEEIKNNGGSIYIGSTTTNFLPLIENTLKEFKKRHPNVQIHMDLEEINILEERSKLGHMDIIIKNDYENIEGFTKIKSFEIEDKFIVSKEHYKNLENKKITLDEILTYPFVLLTSVTHIRRNFDMFLKEKKIDFKPTYEFNSYSLCNELIKNGFGIGIGNPIYFSDDYIILNTDFNLPKRTFDIGYIKYSKNELIEDFKKLIK